MMLNGLKSVNMVNPNITLTLSRQDVNMEWLDATHPNNPLNILVRAIVLGTFHLQMIFKQGSVVLNYDLNKINSMKWDILERALELFPDIPNPEDMASRITEHTGEFVTFDNEDLYNWECMYEQKLASIEI